MRIVVSGGFDPLHIGHVRMLKDADALSGGRVVVLLNTDEWLKRKKGYVVSPFAARKEMIEAVLKPLIHRAKDADGTVVESLKGLSGKWVFANGGDRGRDNTPEAQWCKDNGVPLLFGLGGEKVASSSEMMRTDHPPVQTPWGSYTVLAEGPGYWVKRIVVCAGHRTSIQRHRDRKERFVHVGGYGRVSVFENVPYVPDELVPGMEVLVLNGKWHRLEAKGDSDLEVVEIATGDPHEDDIERLGDDYGRAGRPLRAPWWRRWTCREYS